MSDPFQDGIRLQRENAELRADNKKLREAVALTLKFCRLETGCDVPTGREVHDILQKSLSQTEPKEES